MKVSILSLYPEYFASPLSCGLLARVLKSGLLEVALINYRDFADNPTRRVDDRPFGGGPGMVLQPQVIARALEALSPPLPARVVVLSPSGKPLTARRSRELSALPHLAIVCGHFEGLDQRAIEIFADEEISIGDFVLSSGCPAALALIDAVVRFLPGALGHGESAQGDAFEKGYLKAPQYTRPAVFEKRAVPPILLTGNHREIAAWREAQSLEKTRQRRPDLLQ